MKSRGARLRELKGDKLKGSEASDEALEHKRLSNKDGIPIEGAYGERKERTPAVDPIKVFNRFIYFFKESGRDDSRTHDRAGRDALFTPNTPSSQAQYNPLAFLSTTNAMQGRISFRTVFFPPRPQPAETIPVIYNNGSEEADKRTDQQDTKIEEESQGKEEHNLISQSNESNVAQPTDCESRLIALLNDNKVVASLLPSEVHTPNEIPAIQKSETIETARESDVKEDDVEDTEENTIEDPNLKSEEDANYVSRKDVSKDHSADDRMCTVLDLSNSKHQALFQRQKRSDQVYEDKVYELELTERLDDGSELNNELLDLNIVEYNDRAQTEMLQNETSKSTEDESQVPNKTSKSTEEAVQVAEKTLEAEEIIVDNQVPYPDCNFFMIEPKNDLAKLLDAIMGPSDSRRFNACGAIRMLSMNKKNQQTLVRTNGVLDALIHVCNTNPSGENYKVAFDARYRALEILLNMCMPNDNRIIIFLHPEFVESVVKCAIEDNEKIKMIACEILATLTKTHYCREQMAMMPNLLDVLATTLVVDLDADDDEVDSLYGSITVYFDDDENRKYEVKDLADGEDAYSSGHSYFSYNDSHTLGEQTMLSADISIISSGADSQTIDEGSRFLEYYSQLDSIISSGSFMSGDGDCSSFPSNTELTASQYERKFDKKDGEGDDKQLKEERRETLSKASTNACAALLHLSKQCAVAVSENGSPSYSLLHAHIIFYSYIPEARHVQEQNSFRCFTRCLSRLEQQNSYQMPRNLV
jgi:hypothetical protein